jgi:hypothetical protein
MIGLPSRVLSFLCTILTITSFQFIHKKIIKGRNYTKELWNIEMDDSEDNLPIG